jgi:DNA-binding MarR family transcriptional regulator
MASASSDPEDFIEYRIIRVADLLRRRFQDTLRPHGLTVHQFSVLAVLHARPGVTTAELARTVLLTPQSMRSLVDNLEAVGLVEPRQKRGRGNPTPTTLSTAGAELLRAATASVRDLDLATQEALGGRQAALFDGLTRLEDMLSQSRHAR